MIIFSVRILYNSDFMVKNGEKWWKNVDPEVEKNALKSGQKLKMVIFRNDGTVFREKSESSFEPKLRKMAKWIHFFHIFQFC